MTASWTACDKATGRRRHHPIALRGAHTARPHPRPRAHGLSPRRSCRRRTGSSPRPSPRSTCSCPSLPGRGVGASSGPASSPGRRRWSCMGLFAGAFPTGWWLTQARQAPQHHGHPKPPAWPTAAFAPAAPEVGSSSSSTRAPAASAAATLSRLAWPPLTPRASLSPMRVSLRGEGGWL